MTHLCFKLFFQPLTFESLKLFPLSLYSLQQMTGTSSNWLKEEIVSKVGNQSGRGGVVVRELACYPKVLSQNLV